MRSEKGLARRAARGKRFNYICTAVGFLVLGILVGAVAMGIWARAHRPLNNLVTLAGTRTALDGSGLPVKMGTAYAQTEGGQALRDALRLEEWLETEVFSGGTPLMSIHFGEQYELYLYEGDRASVYYGYASSNTRDEAFYTLPEGTAHAALDYVEASGTPLKLGEGVTVSTFLK